MLSLINSQYYRILAVFKKFQHLQKKKKSPNNKMIENLISLDDCKTEEEMIEKCLVYTFRDKIC